MDKLLEVSKMFSAASVTSSPKKQKTGKEPPTSPKGDTEGPSATESPLHLQQRLSSDVAKKMFSAMTESIAKNVDRNLVALRVEDASEDSDDALREATKKRIEEEMQAKEDKKNAKTPQKKLTANQVIQSLAEGKKLEPTDEEEHDAAEILYELFYTKLKEIYAAELGHAHAGNKIVEELFKFNKQRIAEIEGGLQAAMRMEKLFEPNRCTKLDNVAASGSVVDMQRELLRGNYSINLDSEVPYRVKMERIAQEPCSFLLYKSRHLEKIQSPKNAKLPDLGQSKQRKKKTHGKADEAGKNSSTKAKNIRPHLLAVANAKIIGPRKLNEIVDNCVNMGVALPQYVYNIPKALETDIRSRITLGINTRTTMEAAGRKRKNKINAMLEVFNMEAEEEDHDCNLRKEIQEAVKEAVDAEVAKRRDPLFRDDAPSKSKLIFEDARGHPITGTALVTLVIDVIKREIEYQKELTKVDKVSKWAEQRVRAHHVKADEAKAKDVRGKPVRERQVTGQSSDGRYTPLSKSRPMTQM